MNHLPELNAHFRATETAEVQQGIYRVVGTPDGTVTLLQVTDRDGNRQATGHVIQVSPGELASAFEAAENPDLGFRVGDLLDRILASLKAVFWLVRP